MQRKSLIVAGAAGPQESVDGLLNRLGFSSVEHSPDLAKALELMAQAHHDLVILPVQQLAADQLAALERVLRQERFTFVIGTAPQADTDTILRAMRAGMHEFLVYPPDPKDLAAAVDRLMRRSHVEGQVGEVIAVHGGKGGLGNTSIAVNLAHGIAKNHPSGRVALADLVVTGGDVRVFLNLNPAYDMHDLSRKLDRIDADLLNSLLTPSSDGVWVLPGPDSPEADELIDAATVTAIIDSLRRHFAHTVLDCEHHMSERTLAALDAADRIVLVTQLTVPGLRSTQRTLSLCRRLGYPEQKLSVVVNRHQPGDVLSPADAADALKCEIFWKLPNDYQTSATALTKGMPVAEADPGSKLAWSFNQLAVKIAGGSQVPADGKAARPAASSLRRLFSVKKRS